MFSYSTRNVTVVIKEMCHFVQLISFSVCSSDVCLQRITIPSKQLDVIVNDLFLAIPHAYSPPSLFALLFPPLFLLKLMIWLLISAGWGQSMPFNGIIQALFIPIFNYI